MGVEVVHHQCDPLDARIMDIHQFPDLLRPVASGATPGHVHLAPACQRFNKHEHVGRSVTLVFMVDPGRPPWPCGPCPSEPKSLIVDYRRLAPHRSLASWNAISA